LLAEAKLLESRGSAGEARAVLQSIGSLHPGTPAAMIAEAELARRPSVP
jgi:TolA-binding protein